MSGRLTTGGASLLLTPLAGNYYLALGRGQSPTGLVGEAMIDHGYSRQLITMAVSGTSLQNTTAATYTGFTVTQGSMTHAGLYTAATGGDCIWVGSVETAVNIVVDQNISFPIGSIVASCVLAPTLGDQDGAPPSDFDGGIITEDDLYVFATEDDLYYIAQEAL